MMETARKLRKSHLIRLDSQDGRCYLIGEIPPPRELFGREVKGGAEAPAVEDRRSTTGAAVTASGPLRKEAAVESGRTVRTLGGTRRYRPCDAIASSGECGRSIGDAPWSAGRSAWPIRRDSKHAARLREPAHWADRNPRVGPARVGGHQFNCA